MIFSIRDLSFEFGSVLLEGWFALAARAGCALLILLAAWLVRRWLSKKGIPALLARKWHFNGTPILLRSFAVPIQRMCTAVGVYLAAASLPWAIPGIAKLLLVCFRLVMTLLVLAFGEITPKSMAKEMPETMAMAFAPVLSALVTIFTPLNALFGAWKKFLAKRFDTGEKDTITEGELMTMVSEAENDGELTDRESELIRSAIEFDDVEVEEILTPRVDVVAVADDISLEELAQTFAESGYSRLPVYHGTIDNIIGVVHEKDFYIARLKKATKIDDLVAPTLYTTGSTQISQLLRTLREQHHHMAVVVDEYGGTEGIITLEDILEELVGEIWDEHDEVTEDFRKQSDGSWIVLGSAGVDDLYERLGLPEDEDIDSNTVNGLVQEKTCHLPKVGDRFTLGEYDGVVTRTAKRRVTEVRLTPAEKPEPKKEEDEKPHFNRLTNK